MTTVNVNYCKITGKIKAMHAVGQPPYPDMSDKYMHYLTDASIPFSRLHDVGGLYGGNMYVDIPNIFRDFSANEYDPASYDFGFTDELMKALDKSGVKPIYRLGVTIENFFEIRAYRIFPPSDYGKWARICEHIIRHYNEGWANGFHFGVEYWEIWNEPEDGPGSGMWRGTDVEFFRLYEVASKHLKECFGDKIKIGGYASCGLDGFFYDPPAFGLNDIEPREETYRRYFADYAKKFFAYIKEKGCPLDFFSWHSYSTVDDTVIISRVADELLKQYGYENAEHQMNEWNNAWQLEYRGSSYAASQAAAMMLAMQNTNTEILCYYDARIGHSCFGGLFNPLDYTPLAAYYSFKAFGELYKLGAQVESSCDNPNIYLQAAKDEDGKKAFMLTNTGEDTEILIQGSFTDFTDLFLIDKEHHFTKAKASPTKFTLKKNQTALIQG